MSRTGRPRKNIEKKNFESLCALQATEAEIADFFEVSVDTLERWCRREYSITFAEVFSQKRTKGKLSLRRSQFEMAKTNPTMAIWLGKQWLGQTDKQEVKATVIEEGGDIAKRLEEHFARRADTGSGDHQEEQS